MTAPTTDSRDPGARQSSTAPHASCERAGVVMHASIEGWSAFESENRALATHLIRKGFPIQVAPLGGQPLQPQSPSLRAVGGYLKTLLSDQLTLAESVLYQSGIPSSWNLDFYGRCRVGRAAFGNDRIPIGWAERCNALDELWVPSEFHRETFAASGVDRSKIHVIPQGLDTELFQPPKSILRIRGLPAKSFYFLAAVDRWHASGTDVLIRAFLEEFGSEDDVALVLHCPPVRSSGSFVDFETQVTEYIEITLGRNLEEIPSIAVIVGSLREEDQAALIAASHAFVQPARAEPTGSQCLKALASGLPVIATDWGPLNDFLTEENSFPLGSTGLVAAQAEADEVVEGHRWAEPDLLQFRQRMREVFDNPKESGRRGEQGRRDTVARFDWNVALEVWIDNFHRLLG